MIPTYEQIRAALRLGGGLLHWEDKGISYLVVDEGRAGREVAHGGEAWQDADPQGRAAAVISASVPGQVWAVVGAEGFEGDADDVEDAMRAGVCTDAHALAALVLGCRPTGEQGTLTGEDLLEEARRLGAS